MTKSQCRMTNQCRSSNGSVAPARDGSKRTRPQIQSANRFNGAHFIAPHFDTCANLIADLARASEAFFARADERSRIGKKRPRMFSVQATGCSPIVRAFANGDSTAAEFPDAHTCASGLRVPKAIGDFLILNILRQSNGDAVAVAPASRL